MKAYYELKDEDDKTIIFESRFESGNLHWAYKVNDGDYNLLLQNDVNTQGHTQWFFFRVSNTKKGHSVRYNMLNLAKPDSLFNHGMKPLIYSENKAKEENIGWFRDGYDIGYYANGIKRENLKFYKSYYTLTFTYEFEYDNDTVYFAYCYPYTYSDCKRDLMAIERDPRKSKYWFIRTLCKSLAGNNCDYLTVTNRTSDESQGKKRGIIITARVHPGETVGSWMMKGVLDFITDPDNKEAQLLRDNFVFKIVPMLNPDGVINGNYRWSLSGGDLNRKWKVPSKILHPIIYNVKKMIIQTHEEREVSLFCDLHGHSRKKDIFMYGWNIQNNPEETRIFPFILSKLCPYFNFNYSKFGVQKSKESTARIAMFKEIKTPTIYTWESSFWGNETGPNKGKHFTRENLEQVGKDICRTLLVHFNISTPRDIEVPKEMQNPGSSPQLPSKQYEEDKESFKSMFLDELRNQKHLMEAGNDDSMSGSDDAPSEDNMAAEELCRVVPAVDK